MKQPLKNRFSVAVDDEIFDRVWAVSVLHNKSVAEVLRIAISTGIKIICRDVTPNKLNEIMPKVKEIRGR